MKPDEKHVSLMKIFQTHSPSCKQDEDFCLFSSSLQSDQVDFVAVEEQSDVPLCL